MFRELSPSNKLWWIEKPVCSSKKPARVYYLIICMWDECTVQWNISEPCFYSQKSFSCAFANTPSAHVHACLVLCSLPTEKTKTKSSALNDVQVYQVVNECKYQWGTVVVQYNARHSVKHIKSQALEVAKFTRLNYYVKHLWGKFAWFENIGQIWAHSDCVCKCTNSGASYFSIFLWHFLQCCAKNFGKVISVS